MENFIVSLNVVLPLFLLMMLGLVLRKFSLLGDSFLEKCNKLLFRVFLPTVVFYNLYHADIQEVFNVKLLLFGALGITLYFLVMWFFCSKLIKDKSICDTIVQGSFRSNCVIFGIPIATSLYGISGVGPTALIAAVMIPLFNVFSVFIFTNTETTPKEQIKNVVTNPFIIAVLLGLIFVFLQIKMPTALESAVSSVAQIGSPFSLIVLGASFQFMIPKAKIAPLIVCTIFKLVIEPAIFLTIGYLWLGFTHTYFIALLAAFATPASSTSFIVASAMGGDRDLSAQIVVFTSLFSVLSIFAIVFLGIHFGIL